MRADHLTLRSKLGNILHCVCKHRGRQHVAYEQAAVAGLLTPEALVELDAWTTRGLIVRPEVVRVHLVSDSARFRHKGSVMRMGHRRVLKNR